MVNYGNAKGLRVYGQSLWLKPWARRVKKVLSSCLEQTSHNFFLLFCTNWTHQYTPPQAQSPFLNAGTFLPQSQILPKLLQQDDTLSDPLN